MKDKELEGLLEQLFRQAQMQFGSAVRSRWMHDGDGCPGCGREVTAMKIKKKNPLSLNAFIYREHGVLIAYVLCGKCADQVFKLAKTNPYGTTPLHAEIEKNLKQAYVKHLGH